MKRLLLIFHISLVLGLFILQPQIVLAASESTDNLEIIFEDPLFSSSILWFPGLSINKLITVKNLDNKTHLVSIKAINTFQKNNLAKALQIEITQDNLVDYGQNGSKTLQDFWNENQVDLSLIDKGKTIIYNFKITMSVSSGNEYQNGQASFDLMIGFKDTKDLIKTSEINQDKTVTADEVIKSVSLPDVVENIKISEPLTLTPSPMVISDVLSQKSPEIDFSDQVLGIQTEKYDQKIPLFPIVSVGVILLSFIMILI